MVDGNYSVIVMTRVSHHRNVRLDDHNPEQFDVQQPKRISIKVVNTRLTQSIEVWMSQEVIIVGVVWSLFHLVAPSVFPSQR